MLTKNGRRKIAIAIFSILLASCEQNELTIPVPALPSGGSYSAPSRSAPQSAPSAPMPMLQDPENTSDWTYEVSVPYSKDFEKMRASAEKKCREEIRGDSLSQLLNVEQRTFTPNRSKNVKFLCHFRSEVSRYDDRDRN